MIARLLFIISILTTTLMTTKLYAQHVHSHKLNGLAPIGVMADHAHNKGGVMLSYRYMTMTMSDMLNDSNDASVDDYFSETSYMMAPSKMKKTVHMLGAMYAVSDFLSLTMMIPQIKNEMTMIKKMGRTEVDSISQGMGDIKISSLFKIKEDESSRFITGVGILIPTGSINEEDNETKLAYGMQLGTGSYGLNLTMTYTKMCGAWTLGSQLDLKTYLNENSNDYKLGNQYQANLWIIHSLNDNFNISTRIMQKNIDPIQSTEESVSSMSSSYNPKAQHGIRSFVFLGIDYTNSMFLKGHRLALEYGKPISHQVAGYQLKSEDMIVLGWQKTL